MAAAAHQPDHDDSEDLILSEIDAPVAHDPVATVTDLTKTWSSRRCLARSARVMMAAAAPSLWAAQS